MAFSFMQTIFFIIFFLVIPTCTASLLRHDKECFALFEFKQSISHQPYASTVDVNGFQKLNSWRQIANNASDHDFDCCLWDGVVCSNNGHVIKLDLSQSCLHGSIKYNSSLFNLVHLQELNLSMNNFVESQIPLEIARLKQLRSLDLSNSSFGGQIPIEISHLLQLTTLDLSWNPLKLHSPSLEYLLQNLTSIEDLHLSGVDISSSIPPFLSNFSSLRSMDLESCRLRDEFPSKVFHLPKLKFLNMAENPYLTGSLPEFQNNTLLEHLDLFFTSFSGCIPRSLSNMTQLTYLTLGQNELMGMDPSMPRRLSNLVGLEVCEKRRMNDWIGKLTNLEILVLYRINIYGEILPSLANLTKLSVVVLRESLISGVIPSSFMNLTQLREIDLSKNQLQGQISNSFSNFKSLTKLILSGNKFSGIVDLETFVGLTKLRQLYLDYNKISLVATKKYTNQTLFPELKDLGLSSCNLKELPDFLRLQKKMTILLLSDNKIEGLVPEWIVKNSQETLLVLDLSHNSITGFHQHPHFLPWVRLEVLDIMYNQLQGWLPIPPLTTIAYRVSNNNFTGEIPPLICEVKSLRVLDLAFNNMTGFLPPCLGNLSNFLLELDLQGNNFHGPMMNAFMHGSLMKRIDLSENQFTGQLAKSLANCTYLEYLALGGNSFEDAFPFWLGNLANLQVLILRSNKLYGPIHGLASDGSSFLNLRIADLSNNGFRDQLPEKFFQTWNAMKALNVGKSTIMEIELYIDSKGVNVIPYSMTLTNKGVRREYPHISNIIIAIDLSCNSFEGQIPESLSDLHGLQSINLSNNHLTGRILPSLGNLKNLEALDLSQNELTGEIPHELLQLGFLEMFNVSFNHLHGVIPQGKQFSTFDNNSYMGNPGLCGTPLSKECHISVTPALNSTTNNEYNSFLPRDKTDWIIIFLGVGSGLIIGIIFGNLLYARYSDSLIESSGMRRYRGVRPLRNTRRN